MESERMIKKKGEREKEGNSIGDGKKRETVVVTSRNHVCFLNHTLRSLIPSERVLFPLSFCLILSYNFITQILPACNSWLYHNKPNVKNCYYTILLSFCSSLKRNINLV